MGQITLVCTAHREFGLCNELALLRILGDLKPEVVFQEIHPSDCEKLRTLEARAVRQYTGANTAKEVPVDSHPTPEGLYDRLDAMWDYAESIQEYWTVFEETKRQQYQGGFPLMNSANFETLSIRLTELLDWAISISLDDDLEQTLSAWKSFNASREQAMLDNIYEYCRNHRFANGAFLVGVGHFSSIARRIRDRSMSEPTVATWKLWNRS